MRVLIFIALFWLSSGLVSAQKYSEFFPLLDRMTPDQAKNALKAYLLEEQEHPNANFRLAVLYERNYRAADPLVSYQYAMANAAEAKLRYNKAKLLCDAREVDRNNDEYWPLFKVVDAKGKPVVPFATVSAKMVNGYDSAELFIKNMPPIYGAFTKSVNQYDQAVKLFASINTRYATVEDLYLLYTPALHESLTALKTHYDSCIVYLEQYLALTKAYPLKGYKQSHKILPIQTYRLDGLTTSINFLVNEIRIWNYAEWVKKIQSYQSGHVTELRKNVDVLHEKLDKNLTALQALPYGQTGSLVKPEKSLLFNLNNIDRQSALLPLLAYKTFKQEWLIGQKAQEPDTFYSRRNAALFSNLIYTNRKADTLARALRDAIKETAIDKHADFVAKAYGSQKGLEKYTTDQLAEISKAFDGYTQQLRMSVLRDTLRTESFLTKEKTFRSPKGGISISLVPQRITPEALEAGTPITLFNRKNPDGSAYLAGLYKADKKKNVTFTFLVRIAPDGREAWFKNFNLPVDSASLADTHTYLGPVVLTPEGCGVLLRSEHRANPVSLNTFIFLNEKGEERTRQKLTDVFYPRHAVYSERSNSFIFALKGLAREENVTSAEKLVTLQLNVLGEVLWKREIEMVGSFTDLIPVVDGYLLIGNYLIIRDPGNKELRTKVAQQECSPFIIKLGERGEYQKLESPPQNGSLFVQRVVKVNDNSINLIAFKEKLDVARGKIFTEADNPVHILTNRSAQVVFAK
jgi:hypothetical protein